MRSTVGILTWMRFVYFVSVLRVVEWRVARQNNKSERFFSAVLYNTIPYNTIHSLSELSPSLGRTAAIVAASRQCVPVHLFTDLVLLLYLK